VDRIAEEIAREALADDTFRADIRETRPSSFTELLEQLLQNGNLRRKRPGGPAAVPAR